MEKEKALVSNKSILRLSPKIEFRTWKANLETYLNTKNLAYMINYDVNSASLLSLVPDGDLKDLQNERGSTLSDKLFGKYRLDSDGKRTRLPLDVTLDTINVPFRIPKSLHDFLVRSQEDLQWFHKRMTSIPSSLLGICVKTDGVILCGSSLFPLYSSVESFDEGRQQLQAQKSTVMTVLRRALFEDDWHLLDDMQEPFAAFSAISEHYSQSLPIERDSILSKLESVKFSKMDSYVRQFKRILNEYSLAGGNRHDEFVKRLFLKGIPSSYMVYKHLLPTNSSIEYCFRYFLEIYSKEQLHHPTATSSHGSNSTNSFFRRRNTVSVQKVQVSKSPSKNRTVRCNKCTGWGHKADSCSSNASHCRICGDIGHLMSSCSRLGKVPLAPLLTLLSPAGSTSDDPVVETENSNDDYEDCFVDQISMKIGRAHV